MTHPDSTPTRSADLDALREDLWNARYGDPRYGHEDFAPFPSLIARADESGDRYWQFLVRLEAATAAAWDGTVSDQLTLAVWMMRALDRHADELDLGADRIYDYQRILGEVVESIADLPEVSLEQAEAIIADWDHRVAGTTFASGAHAAAARARNSWHRGDRRQALQELDGITSFRSPAHMCDRGMRSLVAEQYAAWGEHDRAIALVENDLVDDHTGCNFFPAETYHGLVESYAALGRREEALRGVAELERHYGELPQAEAMTTAMIVLLRLNELDRARRIAMQRIGTLDGVATPFVRARRAAALSAVLRSVAVTDPDSMVTMSDPSGRAAVMLTSADAADRLAGTARDAARVFDVRNGNSVVSGMVEEILALAAEGDPTPRPTPIAERTAAELLSGFSAFQAVSDRRASACLEALRPRVAELDGADLARARVLFATDLRRTDPVAAVDAMRQAADDIRKDFPGMAAQAELVAALTAAESGLADPATLLDFPGPDPSWAALSQAAYLRVSAAAIGGLDASRADAAIARGLDVLAAAERGELPLTDAASQTSRDRTVDAQSLAVALNLLRASLFLDHGRPADEPVDAALVAARRMVAAATHPDQRLEAQAELASALAFAARVQSDVDLGAARHLLDEAVVNAQYSQRGAILQQRAELAEAMDHLDGAVEDHEQAIAVWTVDGFAHAADGATLDLAHARLLRRDDPRDVIDLVRPVIGRVAERGDTRSVQTAWQVLGRAQVVAGLPADAVASFTQVLDALTGQEHPGYVAQVRQGRAGELMDLERYDDALADLRAAGELYAEIGAVAEVGDVCRMAALAAHFGGDARTSAAYLAKAAEAYDSLDGEGPVDYLRTRLDIARADIVRAQRPDEAAALLAAVVDRSASEGWLDLQVAGLHLGAIVALAADEMERADDLVERGLQLAPDHPGLNDLWNHLDESDWDESDWDESDWDESDGDEA